jgi:hypothetical protein
MSLPTFVFRRTGEVIKRNKVVVGHRGTLIANSRVYFTVERDIEEYVNIPAGVFTLRMELSPTKLDSSGNPRKQFRIIGHSVPRKAGGLANLLVHRGASPTTLEGCIAPGRTMSTFGVTESDEAIAELFDYCGGFEDQKDAAYLSVIAIPTFNPIGINPTF